MNYDIRPVLKWAGGKRQLLKYLRDYYPPSFNNYYEPFIGGASVLFDLQPKGTIFINDFNNEIINVYETIKEHPNELISKLEIHRKLHTKEYFYYIRNIDRIESQYKKLSSIERAARTMYLNKTCFNGLYRVNKKGYFNTPIGKYKNPLICDKDNILNISSFFNENKVVFSCGDFENSLQNVTKHDFVYLDPPYFPISPTSSFTDYTVLGFSKDDQIRLFNECVKLDNLGAHFILSNSDCEFISNQYKDFRIERIPVNRYINSKKNGRTPIFELVITNN